MKFYAENNFLPETSFGYMMRRSLQAALQLLEPEFAAEGLTGTQWSALACLLFERETMISELAKYLGHDTGATRDWSTNWSSAGWWCARGGQRTVAAFISDLRMKAPP